MSYAPVGFYISCDDALCPECFTEPAERIITGEITADDPAVIFSDTEADTPTHCAECESLIPHSLTSDGFAYVLDRLNAGDGRREILAQWAGQYA